MYNLGDDSELDRLSREAAGRYQHPGKPDWQQMESELDKVLPTTKKRRFGGLWLLPVLLATGGAAYWLSTGHDNKENATATVQPIAKIESRTTQPAPTTINTPLQQAVQEKAALPAESRSPIDTKQKDISLASSKPAAVGSRQTPAHRAERKIDETPSTNSSFTEQVSTNNKQVETSTQVSTNTTSSTTTSKDGVKADPVTTIAGVTETAKTSTTTLENTTAKEESPAPQTTTSFLKEPEPFGKGWSLGLLVGVDKSTVKFAYSSGAGFNAGLTVGYHFNNRWSLHTGAIYTHKQYKMNGEDFTAPKGSWASYYKLENVDGDCSMWEVPLLARYSFSPHGRNSFFVSTGLSSYFMTHENYSYFYHNTNNQPTTRSMDYKSSDTHILSILHLSAGLENRVSNNLSLLIEPYAKLPLGGVGLGDIQLSSFGLNLSLQLRQPRHK